MSYKYLGSAVTLKMNSEDGYLPILCLGLCDTSKVSKSGDTQQETGTSRDNKSKKLIRKNWQRRMKYLDNKNEKMSIKNRNCQMNRKNS